MTGDLIEELLWVAWAPAKDGRFQRRMLNRRGIEMAVAEIRSLRTALATEREAREKAEKELERQADEEDVAARAMAEVIQGLRNRATAAEASLAEAKRLLKRWLSWCDDWHAGKPHPSDDLAECRRFLAQEPSE